MGEGVGFVSGRLGEKVSKYWLIALNQRYPDLETCFEKQSKVNVRVASVVVSALMFLDIW